MPYPEQMVTPMRQELTNLGVAELKTSQDVDAFMKQTGSGLLVFNSVCGCAAGNARPAVQIALQDDNKPANTVTVFAGQDTEAVQTARDYFPQLPPSSPSMIITNNGELVDYIPRHRIEGREAHEIASDINTAIGNLAAAE